jgi:uncharacterized membrane protein
VKEFQEGRRATERIEGFSDGVFAFAMTLLVVQLVVPQLPESAPASALVAALFSQWTVYLAYLVSFGRMLITWVNHHKVFDVIYKADSVFMFLNGFLLLQVAVIPYSTALLIAYFDMPGGYVVTAIYAGNFLGLNIAFNILWIYARGHRLLAPTVTEAQARTIGRATLVAVPLNLFAFGLAFVSVEASLAVVVALSFFFTYFALHYPT